MSFDMSSMSTGGGADLGQPRPGPHLATLVGLVSVGVQEQSSWDNEKAKPPCAELVFVFELSDDTVVIGGVTKNRIFSKTVTCKAGEKANLTKLVSALDPASAHRTFLPGILGTSCMLSLKEEGRKDGKKGTVIKFDSIMPLMQGQQLPVVEIPAFFFDVDNPDMSVYMNSLQPWMCITIKSGLGYSGSPLEAMITHAEAQAQATTQAAPATQQVAQVQQVAQPQQVAQAAPPVLNTTANPGLPSAPPPQVVTQPTSVPPGYALDPSTGHLIPVAQ